MNVVLAHIIIKYTLYLQEFVVVKTCFSHSTESILKHMRPPHINASSRQFEPLFISLWIREIWSLLQQDDAILQTAWICLTVKKQIIDAEVDMHVICIHVCHTWSGYNKTELSSSQWGLLITVMDFVSVTISCFPLDWRCWGWASPQRHAHLRGDAVSSGWNGVPRDHGHGFAFFNVVSPLVKVTISPNPQTENRELVKN